MNYYKAPDNSIHAIEPEFTYLLPANSIPVSMEEAQGIIAAKENTPEMRESMIQELRRTRELILNRLAGIALAEMVNGSTTIVQVHLEARQSLLDITKNLPDNILLMKIEVATRYQAIVANILQNAPALVTAFNDMDI